ncbi:MAG: glycosyl hydrolase family 18 protein [Lentisphaeria bacterium]|nr:glycosyl hydrolase family 18 protein [Lentisphaeria bacterium]
MKKLMKIQHLLLLGLTLSLSTFVQAQTQTQAQAKVIGYIPSYKGLINAIDTVDLKRNTHINISFMNPNENGQLLSNDRFLCFSNGEGDNTSAEQLKYAVDKAHQNNVKVLISLAGGVIPGCSGDWAEFLKRENQDDLVNNLMAIVDEFNLDGLDIDIEGELLTSIDEAGNYTPFIEKLSKGLKSRNKLLTCATASYVGGMVPISSLPYFDFVNIMSYDAIGPSWGTPGVEHATYEQAVQHVNLWIERGLTKEQLVLGVPFYGYGFGQYKANYTFAEIVEEFGQGGVTKDLIGKACKGCDYITYNGVPTIIKKTQLALEFGSGVMIWELTQDSKDNTSLLQTIVNEMVKSNGVTGLDSGLFLMPSHTKTVNRLH